MKIALAQIRCVPGDVPRNSRTIIQKIREAFALGCDIVALPEMSDTGYHMPSIVKTASSWNGGFFAEIADVASETKITVVVGLSAKMMEDELKWTNSSIH